MKKRLLFTITAILMVFAVMLTGCATTSGTPQATAAPSTVPQEVLRVGVDNSYPPMEYVDESGSTIGFDIDMANAIAQKLNMKIELVPTAWDAIFTALNAKKFDCIISSLSITDERKKTILYTQPYIANAQVIVVPANDTSITKTSDLLDKRVGVQLGTTAEEAGTKFTKTTPFKSFDKFDQVIQPFSEMKTGRIDAIIVDEVVARYYVTKDSASFKLSGVRLDPEPIGIGFRQDETVLQSKIDATLTAMKADGSLGEISKKWFGEDITKDVK